MPYKVPSSNVLMGDPRLLSLSPDERRKHIDKYRRNQIEKFRAKKEKERLEKDETQALPPVGQKLPKGSMASAWLAIQCKYAR